jgi:hypothetical protein
MRATLARVISLLREKLPLPVEASNDVPMLPPPEPVVETAKPA